MIRRSRIRSERQNQISIQNVWWREDSDCHVDEQHIHTLHCEYGFLTVRAKNSLISCPFNGETQGEVCFSVGMNMTGSSSWTALRGSRMAACTVVVLVTGCLRRIPNARTSSSCSETWRTWKDCEAAGSSGRTAYGQSPTHNTSSASRTKASKPANESTAW